MRTGLVSLIGLLSVLALAAQEGAVKTPLKRYEVVVDLNSYPQTTPKEMLGSVVSAVAARHIDYVLAQLAEPAWVDRRVKETGGGFAGLVEESTARLVGDAVTVKRFKKLL